MDSLFDRLGLYDFFNVLIAGGIVLFYYLEINSSFVDKCSQYFGEGWISGTFVLGAVYILGILCQEVGRLITETWLKIKGDQVAHFLDESNDVEERLRKKIKNEKIRQFVVRKMHVINNDFKVRVYRKYANDILEDVGEQKNLLKEEQIKFVYAHCIYYIENRGKNQKVEKMRALYGMAQNLVGAGLVVLVADVIIAVFCHGIANGEYLIGSAAVAILLVIIGFVRVFIYSMLMIRMTMGVYEACLENQDFKGVKDDV